MSAHAESRKLSAPTGPGLWLVWEDPPVDDKAPTPVLVQERDDGVLWIGADFAAMALTMYNGDALYERRPADDYFAGPTFWVQIGGLE